MKRSTIWSFIPLLIILLIIGCVAYRVNRFIKSVVETHQARMTAEAFLNNLVTHHYEEASVLVSPKVSKTLKFKERWEALERAIGKVKNWSCVKSDHVFEEKHRYYLNSQTEELREYIELTYKVNGMRGLGGTIFLRLIQGGERWQIEHMKFEF